MSDEPLPGGSLHADGRRRGDALDRAMTIQLILREKAGMPGTGYYVTEEEIRDRSDRALKAPTKQI